MTINLLVSIIITVLKVIRTNLKYAFVCISIFFAGCLIIASTTKERKIIIFIIIIIFGCGTTKKNSKSSKFDLFFGLMYAWTYLFIILIDFD